MTCKRCYVIHDVKKLFRRKYQNDWCHDLKRSCELSGITGKYIDFSKIKLFRPRGNIAVSKNKMVQKKIE